jgi:hypothetical protein
MVQQTKADFVCKASDSEGVTIIMTETVTLDDVDESVRILTKGLMQMLAIQAQHTAALKDILVACSVPEQDGGSPLVKALLTLIAEVGEQSTAIARIEAAMLRTA